MLIIPCYNEEPNIRNIIDQLVAVQRNVRKKHEFNLDMMIINDGSSDRTKELLEESHHLCEYKVINLKKNRGYGYVLKTGFKYASDNSYKWVITFDMDGQHEPTCLYRFISKALDPSTTAKIISGSRYLDPNLFWENPWRDRFLVNTVATGVFKTIGLSITDSFCGMKAHDVETMNDLDIMLDGYDVPIEILTKVNNQNIELIEIAVPLIYMSRDDVVTKEKSESFLFKKGEERIDRYIQIIKDLSIIQPKASIEDCKRIFSKYFNKIDVVQKEKFKEIQESIFTEIANL